MNQIAVIAVVAALFGAAFGTGATLLVAAKGATGSEGDRGPRGSRGPKGPPGRDADAAPLDPEEVYRLIEDDPDRVTQAIQASLDPDPADVESDLETLCFDLGLTEALSDESLFCP